VSAPDPAAAAAPEVRARFVVVDGVRLHVADYGGAGPPLLAVHGTGFCARLFDVLAPYLTPHVHLLALDRRGHGDSDKPETGYQLVDFAEEIAGVVTALGLPGVAALGHSAGGTALAMAEGRHRGCVSRIAMVDPIMFAARAAAAGVRAVAASLAERTAKRRGEWPSAAAMRGSLAARPPFDTWSAAALDAYVRHAAAPGPGGTVALKCPPALEAKMYGHDADLDVFAELAPVTVPVLVVRGERTDRFPRESAERGVAAMRGGRLVELAGLSHFAPMEDPAAVAGAVLPFLLER
jgi:pimeloyl-ACP methyl ester carboxylesterase